MERLKQEQVRSMIGNFFREDWAKGKVYSVKHFKAVDSAKHSIKKV